jgi:hypothetical protein
VSPEFPSDNPELWRARPSNVPLALALDVALEAAPETEPEVEVADFDDADFAVVEEVVPAAPAPPPAEDPFRVFVRTLVEVALAAGTSARVVAILPAMLGAARLDVQALEALDAGALEMLVAANLLARTESGAFTRSDSLVATAQAWRATLLGEEAVLSVSSTLDEWSAHIVATLAAAPERREIVRRELRSRGIAAFGLIEAA